LKLFVSSDKLKSASSNDICSPDTILSAKRVATFKSLGSTSIKKHRKKVFGIDSGHRFDLVKELDDEYH
jgi:hypothetical protein